MFLRVNAKTPLPCLMAAARSVSEEERRVFIVSKVEEEGKASRKEGVTGCIVRHGWGRMPLARWLD